MSTRKTKVELEGVEAVKELQEKQIANLQKATKALETVQEGYIISIEKGNKELNDLYYKIQDETQRLTDMENAKVAELKQLEADETVGRAKKVETLQAKINGLQKEFDTKLQDFKVSHKLAIKASKEETLNELLGEFELAYITKEDLTVVNTQLETIADETKKKSKAEIAIVSAQAERKLKSTISEMTLKHTANTAKLEAQNENAQQQLEFYKDQLAAAEDRIQSILDNQVKVAEATKAIQLSTGNGK